MNKKTAKICLLMMVMVLGAYSVSGSVAYSNDESVVNADVNQADVKANKETLEKAETSMANKDFQSAIVYLTAYISNKPKKYEAYKLRGDCFYALHQFRLAEADYQKAISLKTDDDKFITGTKVISAVVLGADKQSQYQNPELGNLYGRLMYAQKALNNPAYELTYSKAFEFNSHIYLPKPKKEDIYKINCPQKYGKILNPQGVDQYVTDAISKIEEGQFSEAVYKIQYITSNYPKYYLGHYLMGVAMAGLEQDEDAIHSYEKALSFNPYDFETFASLGQLFYQKSEKTFSVDDARKSIEYFNKALKYNPNCHIYHYYIGLNQMIIGDYSLAISSFDSAIKLKSNDYNSMYYKLIAQHLKGDYLSVVNGTTNLLYRHVSNYNSVLYLRSLAYYKLRNLESALADLEKIHNNMNDIYNADIKPLSKKEQTLSHYLYYLKSEILQDLGLGVKADLEKAFENPIIEELSDGKISSDFVLTQKQIDTEYDYIRTTFTDLSLSFEYLSPDYKIVLLTPVVDNVVVDNSELASNTLKLSTDPVDTLPSEQTSIAQLLAAKSFGVVSSDVEPVDYSNKVNIEEKPVVANHTGDLDQVELAENIVSENTQKPVDVSVPVKEESEKIETSEVSVLPNEKSENDMATPELPKSQDVVQKTVSDDVVPVQEIVEENQKEPETIEVKDQQESIETSQDLNVKNDNVVKTVEKDEVAVSKEKSADFNAVPKDETSVESTVSEAPKSVPDVIEKHAQVNLEEFNTVQSRKVLVLKDDDEIIEFEPTSLREKVENDVPQVLTSMNSSDTNKISDEIIKHQQLPSWDEEEQLTDISENTAPNSTEVNVTQTEVTTKIAEVQDVEIPQDEIGKNSETKQENSVSPSADFKIDKNSANDVEIPDEVQKEVDISADKALKDILEAEKSAVNQQIEDNKIEKPKKSWFGWFKRNKKDSLEEQNEVSDDLIENLSEDEDVKSASDEDEVIKKQEETVTTPQVTEVKTKVEEVQQVEQKPVAETSVQNEVAVKNENVEENPKPIVENSDVPLIRTTKAEIEELDEEEFDENIEVNYEKKKFVWWWKRVNTDKNEVEISTDEKVKSKKFDWKKLFTRKQKVNSQNEEFVENLEE